MGQHVFLTFSLIIEGATEKVLQFIMPLKLMFIKNVGFNEQKCIFDTTDILKKYFNNFTNTFIFKLFCLPFQSCPVKYFVLHKMCCSLKEL